MLEILDETRRYPYRDALARALTRLMDHLGLAERELTVVLCDDGLIRRYNRDHRGVDAPTDVLSYPTHEPGDTTPIVPHLGDILISVETASQQAPTHGLTPQQEVMVLAAHGLTHLLGYDHDSEDAWQRFTTIQELMLTLS